MNKTAYSQFTNCYVLLLLLSVLRPWASGCVHSPVSFPVASPLRADSGRQHMLCRKGQNIAHLKSTPQKSLWILMTFPDGCSFRQLHVPKGCHLFPVDFRRNRQWHFPTDVHCCAFSCAIPRPEPSHRALCPAALRVAILRPPKRDGRCP